MHTDTLGRLLQSKPITLLIAGIVSLSLVGSPSPVYAQRSALLSSQSSYEGEYVVTLAPQSRLSRTQARNVQALSDGTHDLATIVRRYGTRTALVSSGRSASARYSSTAQGVRASALRILDDYTFCKDLISRGVVESCTPNFKLTTQEIGEPDPLFGDLWGLTNEQGVGALGAWQVTTGSSQVVVAVIDTGIDYNHPDLAANIWVNPGEVVGNGIDDDGNGYIDDIHGANTSVWAGNKGDPFDDNQHGTHVAGTIGALSSNGVGVSGINHSVTLLPIKFMDASGAGRLSDAIAAIDYMIDLKLNRGVNIRVANNSWGGGGYSPALHEAVERARDAGIVFVVAAGNSASDLDLFPSYPASFELSNVVTVAAVDRHQNLASFSNYGAEAVDVAAPGVDIVSTLPNGQYGTLSGTSMATPHVVGSLALLFASEPTLTVEQAIERVTATGRELSGLVTNGGETTLIRSRRGVDASRMVYNQSSPLPAPDGGLPACGYVLQAQRLDQTTRVDTLADRAPIINQVDEGGYYRVDLPFEFPFFRTKTSSLFISPNGVVYLNEPRNPDYQCAYRAPNNSIAAFQTDLIPRTAAQGVRVYTDLERATIFWSSEHYSLAGGGVVGVRLSLFRNGLAEASVSFAAMNDPSTASRVLLGDPFVQPPIAPLALIGASATSLRMSNTLDLPATQRELATASGELLGLRVSMAPTCFTLEDVETKLSSAQIDSIRLRLSKDRRKLVANFVGTGSGLVPMQGYVNGKQCSQAVWGSLQEGVGRAQIPIIPGVSKLALRADATQKGISLRSTGSQRSTRAMHAKQCDRLLRALTN